MQSGIQRIFLEEVIPKEFGEANTEAEEQPREKECSRMNYMVQRSPMSLWPGMHTLPCVLSHNQMAHAVARRILLALLLELTVCLTFTITRSQKSYKKKVYFLHLLSGSHHSLIYSRSDLHCLGIYCVWKHFSLKLGKMQYSDSLATAL